MSEHRPLPSVEYLRECFEYLAHTGTLVWRMRPLSHFETQRGCNVFNKSLPGTVAGNLTRPNGYMVVRIAGFNYQQHRVIYALLNGEYSTHLDIDHINGNKSDNRIQNLRLATRCQNKQNVNKLKNNTSGFLGVDLYKGRNNGAGNKKWRARISVDGVIKYLGYYASPQDAAKARDIAAKTFHGQFGVFNNV